MENENIIPLIPDDAFMFRRGKSSIDGFGRVVGIWNDDLITPVPPALRENVSIVAELKFVSACKLQSDGVRERAELKIIMRREIYRHFYGELCRAMDELAFLINEDDNEKALRLACNIRAQLRD